MPSKSTQRNCLCGNNVGNGSGNNQTASVKSSHTFPSTLDASFVHLPPPSSESGQNMEYANLIERESSDERDLFNQGILNTYRHINTLLQVAEGHLDLSEIDPNGDICLCTNCIERLVFHEDGDMN